MGERLLHWKYELDKQRRAIVLAALIEVCEYRKWALLAAHVRTFHVHSAVQAVEKPEKILNAFKAYSSRHLNNAGIDPEGCKRWAHHGSTRYLWKPEDAEAIIHYILFEQGEPMEVYRGKL